MDAIKRNYENILGINPKTDIYTLGAYLPKSLQSEEMDIFRYLVIAYNASLMDLCKEYNITFVDTEKVGKKYNNSTNDFHISTAGHNALANHILGYMYQNKIVSKKENNYTNYEEYKILDYGSTGVILSIKKDYMQSYERANELSGYPQKRELDIANEHIRETEIFQKVLINKTREKLL